MTDIIWERAIALFGMGLWLVFPIGIVLSIIRLDKMAHRTAYHPAVFYPNVSEGPYHFALHAAEAGESSGQDEDEDEDYKQHNEEWEEESMENEGGSHSNEEENPLLHYLRGREKLHEKGGMNPPGE